MSPPPLSRDPRNGVRPSDAHAEPLAVGFRD